MNRNIPNGIAILYCNMNGLKKLKSGLKYKIKEIETINFQMNTVNGVVQIYYDNSCRARREMMSATKTLVMCNGVMEMLKDVKSVSLHSLGDCSPFTENCVELVDVIVA